VIDGARDSLEQELLERLFAPHSDLATLHASIAALAPQGRLSLAAVPCVPPGAPESPHRSGEDPA
jgi:hypothetical protein